MPMDALTNLYASHPFWIWLAFGAVILVGELSTGSGWLLWPAAAAAVMAVLTFLVPNHIALHLAIFAGLTIVATVTARRYLPRDISGGGPDINDNITRLIGARGEAASIFAEGRGRVHVEGKEWDAQSDDALIPGKAVEVLAVLSAASLRVKAA
jgi:membrane protein implicated in regulation of membrane protease activity